MMKQATPVWIGPTGLANAQMSTYSNSRLSLTTSRTFAKSPPPFFLLRGTPLLRFCMFSGIQILIFFSEFKFWFFPEFKFWIFSEFKFWIFPEVKFWISFGIQILNFLSEFELWISQQHASNMTRKEPECGIFLDSWPKRFLLMTCTGIRHDKCGTHKVENATFQSGRECEN